MTKTEALRQAAQQNTLLSLGFTTDEAAKLRRISLTLRRWYEYECGTGNNHADYFIVRESDGTPYMETHLNGQGVFKTYRHRIADRETGALRRLAAIINARNERRAEPPLKPYIQTDPRGAALYILRPNDVPEGKDPAAYYSQGICIY